GISRSRSFIPTASWFRPLVEPRLSWPRSDVELVRKAAVHKLREILEETAYDNVKGEKLMGVGGMYGILRTKTGWRIVSAEAVLTVMDLPPGDSREDALRILPSRFKSGRVIVQEQHRRFPDHIYPPTDDVTCQSIFDTTGVDPNQNINPDPAPLPKHMVAMVPTSPSPTASDTPSMSPLASLTPRAHPYASAKGGSQRRRGRPQGSKNTTKASAPSAKRWDGKGAPAAAPSNITVKLKAIHGRLARHRMCVGPEDVAKLCDGVLDELEAVMVDLKGMDARRAETIEDRDEVEEREATQEARDRADDGEQEEDSEMDESIGDVKEEDGVDAQEDREMRRRSRRVEYKEHEHKEYKEVEEIKVEEEESSGSWDVHVGWVEGRNRAASVADEDAGEVDEGY
ncbi:hypothetical protein HK101_008614, partial [Irineochytrium annulatum]